VARGVRGLTPTNGFAPVVQNVPAISHQNFLLGDAKRVITAALAGASRQTLGEDALLKEHLRVELKRFIQKRTGAKPVITFVIVRV
jgi:mRNA degradation ribonuclease J1/J2